MKAIYSKPACRKLSATAEGNLLLGSIHTGGADTGGTGGGRQGIKQRTYGKFDYFEFN